MKECPACRHCFPDKFNNCPSDGDALQRTITGDTVLDRRYQLDLRLGHGGMGIVFKARHIFLKTPYAIKVILPDLVGNDPMLVTRFRQEAMVAARISHRNIVNVTDFGVATGGMPYLVMEFIKGKSLQHVLAEQGRLSPERALEIMAAVCAGVGAAHQQGIVHRDLKPLNIMLQDDVPLSEGVKVLDFGLAKIKSGEFLGSFVAAQTTGLMGSPFYMAPELWSEEEPDKRVDVYSLGVILFQILTNDLPFKGATIPVIMNKHLSQPPPKLASLGVHVPPAIDDVLLHALAKKSDDRLASVEDLINELRRAVLSAHSGFVQLPAPTLSESQQITMFLPEGTGEIDRSLTFEPHKTFTEDATLPDSKQRIEHEADRLRYEFEEAQRRADQARQRAEEAAQRRAKEEAEHRRAKEEAARKLAEEEAARKRIAEDARRQAEEEAARKRAEEEAAIRLAAEEARKRAEEEAARNLAAEEGRRLAREMAEAQRRAEDARLLAEEEARRRTEEEAARLRAEEKARELAAEVEEVRQRAAEARERAEAETRKHAEEEQARKNIEAKLAREREEAAAKIQADEEAKRKRAAEDADRLALEVAEARQRAEEARLRAEEESRKRLKEEEARKRAEEEAKRLAQQVAEAERRVNEIAERRAREDAAFKQEQQELAALHEAQRLRAANEAEQKRLAEEAAAKHAQAEEERQAQAEALRKQQEADYAAAIERAEERREQLQSTRTTIALTETMVLPANASRTPEPISPGADDNQSQHASQATMVHKTRQTSRHQVTREQVLELTGAVGSAKKSSPSPLPIIAGVGAAGFMVLLILGVIVYQLALSGASQRGQGSPSPSASGSASPAPVVSGLKVDGGAFQMGRSDVWLNSNDTFELIQYPAHPVTVSSFWMDKTEVTNSEYAAFVKEKNHAAPPYWTNGAPPPEQLNWPVTEVSLDDAKQFAEWRSKRDNKKYRLPKEEEWEYAARNGAQETLYPWGNEWLEDRANLNAQTPTVVGSYPKGASRGGVLDLIGNVWEWTSSKATIYPNNDKMLPSPGRFVIRGGGFSDSLSGPRAITATRRYFYLPTGKDKTLGFRLVSDEP
jgi:serine/threonine protein kinase/formylglycine-generating enzyme required for sulfatase activity